MVTFLVYFPGIPVFQQRSDPLGTDRAWNFRPEQLIIKTVKPRWIMAPSIRYHDGTSFILLTLLYPVAEAYRDNYIITAKDPAGPWSDPCFIKGADGINSSLFL